MIWYGMDTAPRDGRMVMLWYREFCGEKNYVTAGFWDDLLREGERTWCHAVGHGDADLWAPMPDGPDAATLHGCAPLSGIVPALSSPHGPEPIPSRRPS